MVVLYHAEDALHRIERTDLPNIFLFGAAGVDIFFVLSGFIISYVTQTDFSPANFIIRRLMRVVPIYWLFTLLAMLSFSILQPSFYGGVPPISHVIKSLFFVPHYHPVFHDKLLPVLVVGWSLNFEMLFYIFYATILLLPNRLRLGVAAGWAIAAALIGSYLPSSYPVLHFFTNPLILEFVAGIAICQLFIAKRLPSLAWSSVLIASGAVGLIVSSQQPISFDNQAANWGIPAILIVVGAVGLEQHAQIAYIRVIKLLGDSSYSIYLSHILTISACKIVWVNLAPGLSHGGAIAFMTISVVAAVAVGIACYVIVESPLLQKLYRWLPQQPMRRQQQRVWPQYRSRPSA